MSENQAEKQAIRERVWRRLEAEQASPPGRAWGRIPDFYGNVAAADQLTKLAAWRDARVIKVNPDQAQVPVRARALREGKLVYMAVPKLAKPQPFYRLDPEKFTNLDVALEDAVTSGNAAKYAPTVDLEDMATVDLVVCGSAVVNRTGVRIGKGAGYSDIEVGLLATYGLISDETTIATTVHETQIVDDELPRSMHDFTLDCIATPNTVVFCQDQYRPDGLIWGSLRDDQIEAIPVLSRMRGYH